MMNRSQIEAILKINGVSPTSPEEQIRSVLMSARYNKDEVDTALMVLRENTSTKKIRVDGLHKVFRSDEALAPNEISALLGIDVDPDVLSEVETRTQDTTTIQNVLVTIFAILVAIGGLAIYMYLNRIGIFHPSVY
jgi:hypothetical protein